MAGPKGSVGRDAYGSSGVDVAAGERAVELMRAHVESTRRPEVVGGLGGFGGAIAIPAGLSRAAARRLDRRSGDEDRDRAIDRPLRHHRGRPRRDVRRRRRLLRRRAAGLPRLHRRRPRRPRVGRRARRLGRGRLPRAGCALIGGETAEHPGLMDDDAFDVSGCCVGVVERSDVIDGTAVRAGDAIIGLAVVGPARQRLLARPGARRAMGPRPRRAVPGAAPALARRRRADAAIATAPNEAMATLGDVLLTPTRIYARADPRRPASGVGPAATTCTAWRTSPAAACPGTCHGPCRTSGRAARPGPLADAVGHAGLRGARRARRRGAPGDIQRRTRDGRWSCRAPRRPPRSRRSRAWASRRRSSARSSRRPTPMAPAMSRRPSRASRDGHRIGAIVRPDRGRGVGRRLEPAGAGGRGSSAASSAARSCWSSPTVRARRSTGRPSRGSRPR